jgi:hypothetical protein
MTLSSLVKHTNNLDSLDDIVECGVWNGGSAAIMGLAHIGSGNGRDRKIWLFDSFQGVPLQQSETVQLKEEVTSRGGTKEM